MDAHTTPDLRAALRGAATGVAVVTTLQPDGKPYGLTIGSFASISLDPPLVLWSLAGKALSHPIFERALYFAINILSHDQVSISKRFSTRDIDRFAETTIETGLHQLPLIVGSLAWLECERESTVPGGDHSIFLGRVLRARSFEKKALLHCQGDYAHPAALATS
jgi:flavin reductase (DIM6/NTAB) family NADH-FMN oxidoreductase RutF